MSYIEIFLIGVGLSMDAFAVAIGKGLTMKTVNKGNCLIIALFFGGFQALMPLLGYLLGRNFAGYIESVDHWIAFFLLLYIGGKMVIDGIRDETELYKKRKSGKEAGAEEIKAEYRLDIKELFILAIATSIDALAMGVTFSFLRVDIIPVVTIIGITTFVFSTAGVYVGNLFGNRYESKATIAGGLILIILGLRILISHLIG